MSEQRTIGVDCGGRTIVVGLVERDETIVRLEQGPTPELGQDAGVIGATLVGFEALDAADVPAARR